MICLEIHTLKESASRFLLPSEENDPPPIGVKKAENLGMLKSIFKRRFWMRLVLWKMSKAGKWGRAVGAMQRQQRHRWGWLVDAGCGVEDSGRAEQLTSHRHLSWLVVTNKRAGAFCSLFPLQRLKSKLKYEATFCQFQVSRKDFPWAKDNVTNEVH